MFPYCDVVEDIEKASVSFCSKSERFLAYFVNNCGSPSIITSWDASFDIKEIIIDKADVRFSKVFIDGILVTPRAFPRKSIPSSISSFRLTKIVSGSRDHIPGFAI